LIFRCVFVQKSVTWRDLRTGIHLAVPELMNPAAARSVLISFAVLIGSATVACGSDAQPEPSTRTESHLEGDGAKRDNTKKDDGPPEQPTKETVTVPDMTIDEILAEAHQRFPDSQCWDTSDDGTRGYPCGDQGLLCCDIPGSGPQ
jgi:hypothetical protein